MAYTTIKKPSDYFNTKLYTGNGSTNAITGVGFQPDFTWIKNRNTTGWHTLLDVIRGTGKTLYSNRADAEGNYSSALSSFDSDGFTVGNNGDTNGNGNGIVSWNWLGANGTTANTDGSISSTVSANTTSGFSIVKFNTNGQSGTMTCGHGLGAVPKMIITKTLDATDNWYTYHEETGNAKYMLLDTTAAETSNSNSWSSTNPTSSVFSMNTAFWGASTNEIIAYCFAEKQGFSKIGSYVGNGSSDGSFCFTGMKPSFVMIKRTDSATSWQIIDNKRNSFNLSDKLLFPDLSDAEATSSGNAIDLLSNGFKTRGTGSQTNASGGTYIYMAFAEQPLVGDNPATAR